MRLLLYIPWIVPLTLTGPKMGTNSFGNKNFMQPMRRLSMHLMRSQVFFFWGGGGLFFPLFSMCSPWDYPSSQVVPQDFQIAPWIYPIQFAQSSTLMCINWKSRMFAPVLWRLSSNKRFHLGSAQCFQNNWWWANQCVPFQKRNESVRTFISQKRTG
jgi:hypothetical protein